MCYGDPVELLKKVIDGRTLQTNEAGHTVLGDFEHFCAYSGCDAGNAWAKLAFVTARLAKSSAYSGDRAGRTDARHACTRPVLPRGMDFRNQVQVGISPSVAFRGPT
jgi:hypothetical protein